MVLGRSEERNGKRSMQRMVFRDIGAEDDGLDWQSSTTTALASPRNGRLNTGVRSSRIASLDPATTGRQQRPRRVVAVACC